MPEEVVRSASNPLVRRLRQLIQKGGGPSCLLEGPKLLEEALAAGVEVAEVVATPRFARSERGKDLLRTREEKRVRLLDERLFASLSELETSQGVLAMARRPTFREGDLFGANPLLVVAVGIQNPGNLGGLLRTAEAAGATGAYLTPGTADPLSGKALRGSMGSAFRLPHVRQASIESVLASLRARRVRTVATVSGPGGTPYDVADLSGPVAILLGSEGRGLSDDVIAGADQRLRVPLLGGVESLNVGVAAGVILFEAARQRRR